MVFLTLANLRTLEIFGQGPENDQSDFNFRTHLETLITSHDHDKAQNNHLKSEISENLNVDFFQPFL